MKALIDLLKTENAEACCANRKMMAENCILISQTGGRYCAFDWWLVNTVNKQWCCDVDLCVTAVASGMVGSILFSF